MNPLLKCIVFLSTLMLVSCASLDIKHPKDTTGDSSDSSAEWDKKPAQPSEELLPHTKYKNGQVLNLVRAMEGGACKDDERGAKGVFLVYANPDDIERIKKEQGDDVFGRFERQIRDFSLVSFQKAVTESNLGVDPFALDANDAQRKAADELAEKFSQNIADTVKEFIRTTTLNIDVEPLRSSFLIYIDGCEATHLHDDS